MNIGLPEILLIVFIAFLLFGARKLPEAARSIGKALNEFKRGFRDPIEGGRRDDAPDKES